MSRAHSWSVTAVEPDVTQDRAQFMRLLTDAELLSEMERQAASFSPPELVTFAEATKMQDWQCGSEGWLTHWLTPLRYSSLTAYFLGARNPRRRRQAKTTWKVCEILFLLL